MFSQNRWNHQTWKTGIGASQRRYALCLLSWETRNRWKNSRCRTFPSTCGQTFGLVKQKHFLDFCRVLNRCGLAWWIWTKHASSRKGANTTRQFRLFKKSSTVMLRYIMPNRVTCVLAQWHVSDDGEGMMWASMSQEHHHFHHSFRRFCRRAKEEQKYRHIFFACSCFTLVMRRESRVCVCAHARRFFLDRLPLQLDTNYPCFCTLWDVMQKATSKPGSIYNKLKSLDLCLPTSTLFFFFFILP